MAHSVVNTIVPSCLIGSSYLQVTKTGIKSYTSSNSRQIQPVSLELLAVELMKKC